MPLGEEFLILAFIFGVLIGSISAIVGIGGGILFIPTSIFIFGFPLKDAVVISLFSMTGLNISASIRYMKMKLINYRLSIIYNVWDLPGVIFGAWITTLITQNILSGICGVFIMVLSIILFRKNHKDNSEMKSIQNSKIESISDSNVNLKRKKILGINNPVAASISSFSGGFISGLGGVGGGTADTTTMILLGIDPKEAAATSQFAMVFTSISGVIIHILFGTYNDSFLWPTIMTLGAVFGAQIGTYLAIKMESIVIRKLLAAFAFYTGILLILLMFDIDWI